MLCVFIATITGTRSLIFFADSSGVYAVIYQQWGGELEGVGYTLATFLKNVVYRDVLEEDKIICCGFGNLVGRYVRKIKEDKSGHPFYLCPNDPGLEEEYNYHVQWKGGKVLIQVNNSGKMSVDEFFKICETSRSTGSANSYLAATLTERFSTTFFIVQHHL